MKKYTLILMSLLISVPPLHASYLNQLQQRALDLKLAKKIQWQRLLHYQPQWLTSQPRSQITDPHFFFHPQGNTDPQAELWATLAHFFVTEGDDENSAPCRFPARFQWLKNQLTIHEFFLPARNCQRLNHWRSDLTVNQISLVFPVAYLNNPASMFGHTFLKFDLKKGSELLAWTINYAAMTQQERGIKFVVKGLLGGYQGKFSLSPYYVLLKEYTDLDHRDLWEYQLNFNPQEIERLLLHVWELLPVHFDYYFINKNCAYQLLALLEIARPSLELTSNFKLDAIPTDTVRAIINQPKLLKKTHYRPALTTELRAKATLLSHIHQDYAKALALKSMKIDAEIFRTLTVLEHVQILDLAFDYLSYLNAKKIKNKQNINGQLAYQLLAARSQLAISSPIINIPQPVIRPDQGHLGNRAQLVYGYDGQDSFIEANYRWAYHDFEDSVQGFVKGGEVEFLKVALRYYPITTRFNLEALQLLKLTSLPDYDPFIQPFSWQVAVAFKSMRLADNRQHLIFDTQLGGGLSVYPTIKSLVAASLLTSVQLTPHFHQYSAVGMGGELRWHYDPFPFWGMSLTATIVQYVQGRSDMIYAYQFKQQFNESKHYAFMSELKYGREFGRTELSAKFALQFYF